MHLRRACFGVLFVGMFCGTVLRAQNAPAPANAPVATFQADVRVVLVDVVVTDKKGDPVPGLQAADFQILEDGKPQAISSFEEHKGAPPTETKLPPMPPGVFTNYPSIATADSVNVLLIDTLNTSVLDQAFVRQQMLRYLKTIPPGARIAVFGLNSRLRLIQEFTTDSAVLMAALNDKKGLSQQQSPLLQSQSEETEIKASIEFMELERQGPPPVGLMAETMDPVNALREMMAETSTSLAEQRIAITLQALQQLGRYLSGFSGRKNLIWLSASFPFRFLPDKDLPNSFRNARDFQNQIEKTADILTTAQVAVYPVTAQGLIGESAYEADANGISMGGGRNFTNKQIGRLQGGIDDRENRRFSMEELAKDTGGQAFTDTNGINDALARVTNNGMRYYSLSYVPANKTPDRKYRHISVNLTKEKYKLFYRRGYYAVNTATTNPAEQKMLSDPLLPLVAFATPNISQIVFKLRVAPSDPQPAKGAPRAGVSTDLKGPVTRYAFDFAVAVDDVRLHLDPDGKRTGTIEWRVAAFDSDGKPVNMVGKGSRVSLTPADYAALRRVGLQIHEELDVPGNLDLHFRAGIYDLNSGKAGTIGLAARHIPRNAQVAR